MSRKDKSLYTACFAVVAAGALMIVVGAFTPYAASAQPAANRAALATSMPASAPASQAMGVQPPAGMPAVNLEDITSIVKAIIWAIQHKAWPFLLVLAFGVYLFIERHTPGIFGPRASAWLASWRGILVTSVATALWTAGLTVAASGWKAFGAALVLALVMALINAAAQYGKTPHAAQTTAQ